MAERAGVPDRAVPASVARSRHRPGRRDRYGACLGLRAEQQRANPAGEGNAPRTDPLLGRPQGTCGPVHYEAGKRLEGHRPLRVPAVLSTASETVCGDVAGSGASCRHRDDKTAGTGADARPLPRGAAGTGSRASLHTWVLAASRVPRVAAWMQLLGPCPRRRWRVGTMAPIRRHAISRPGRAHRA